MISSLKIDLQEFASRTRAQLAWLQSELDKYDFQLSASSGQSSDAENLEIEIKHPEIATAPPRAQTAQLDEPTIDHDMRAQDGNEYVPTSDRFDCVSNKYVSPTIGDIQNPENEFDASQQKPGNENEDDSLVRLNAIKKRLAEKLAKNP